MQQARKFEKFAHPGAADGVRCDDARAGRSRDERVDGLTIMLALLLSALTVDYEIITASGTDAGPAVIYKTVLPNASIEIATPPAYGYEAKVDNGARALRAFGPLGGNPCGVLSTTSKTAEAHACRWAVNAGPYDTKTHQCPSVFISNGIVQGNGSWAVQFGVTGNGSWVIGTIDATTAKELDVRESVPGFGWLVRNGVNVAGTGDAVAPRTTIGTTADGMLLILEVDGCEPNYCAYKHLGRTLHEMADLLISRGALHAINLDGGGSSTTVENGTTINRPTSSDNWAVKQERGVTTIACVV